MLVLALKMSRTIQAEYIASECILKLEKPLPGIEDHTRLEVEIRVVVPTQTGQPWMKLEGSLSKEEGEALARAVHDAFGRDL